MAEYIERDALLKIAIKEQRFVFRVEDMIENAERVIQTCYKDLADVVRSIPAADVVPVVHGSIVETAEDGKSKRYCSCCGDDCTAMTQWMWPKYCPNCGARMDGDRK